MSEWERAAELVEEEARLGERIWMMEDGTRAYLKQDGDTDVLTILQPDGPGVVCEYPGINLEEASGIRLLSEAPL